MVITLNCVVLIKQVPDPELRLSALRIVQAGKQVDFSNAAQVPSPFDENALEMALQIKDKIGGKVGVISLGDPSVEKTLRKGLALKADAAVLIEEQGLDRFNSFQVAFGLYGGIQSLDFSPDLILCGCQAADTDAGHIGPMLAELLGWPCVSMVTDIRVGNRKIVVTNHEEDMESILEVDLPAVITVNSAPTNQLRYPKVKDVITSQRLQIRRVNGFTTESAVSEGINYWKNRVSIRQLELLRTNRKCHLIAAKEPEQMAAEAIQEFSALGLM